MKYQSTRNKAVCVSSAEAIKKGLSLEGGLFVPCQIPKLSQADISSMTAMSYNERAIKILSYFLTDYTPAEIADCVNSAYNKEKFETAEIAPVYNLNGSSYFLELWHGPTCAFKDMALQILPHLLTKAVKKTGEKREVVILVATSGDTGKAALEGFRDVDGTRIIVFYPENGVSDIQKRQMITQEGNNVDIAAVIGNFDDAQNGVKKIFTDSEYAEILASNNFILSSANSINWGRLVPQIIYYFSAYASLLKNGEIKEGEKINVVVPTGNFGNILAAYYAKEMGLPISKLICASNENNVLTDFINTGVYNKNREFKTTTSPSMDILISSNLERFLFHITGENEALVNEWMTSLKEDGKYDVGEEIRSKIQEIFYAGYCDDIDTAMSIKDTYDGSGYIMDTHTAVAKKVYDDYALKTGDKTKTVIVSTASPFKFNDSVLSAICGEQITEGKNEFELLELLAEKTGLTIPASLDSLKTKPIIFTTSCEKEEMYEIVSHMLNLA